MSLAQHNHIDNILESVYRPDKVSDITTSIDPVILRSWQRCITHFNLEPSPTRGARILTQQELLDYRLPVEEFLHIAKSGLSQLYKQVNALDYVVLLTDSNGVTVDYIGSEKYDAELKSYGLYLGADWNEKHTGTCGVGICATEMIPVTAHQTDHFDLINTRLTCSAAPIYDPEGKPLAVLDVSALDSPKNKDSQYLLLQLVKMHAQIIESANFLHHFQKDYWIVRFGSLQEYVNVNSPNMLAIDDTGTIMGLNSCARKILDSGIVWKDATWSTAIGKNISDYFGCELGDIINIHEGSDKYIKPATLLTSGEQLFVSSTAPSNADYKYSIKPSHQPRKVTPMEVADFSLDKLAGDDPVMQKSIKLAKRLVDSKIYFLIQGETGSGKEVFARAIHNESRRRGKPFIAVNCAAIPESLIESELFGYKPGTFTGARSKGMVGLIQQSSGGTLFLDEIGDMPIHLQTRLLRVLSEREVLPLGSDKTIPVDLNVIAATHKNIDDMIREGQFREDLYYRIAGATLLLPSLRERADKEFLISRAMIMESGNPDISISPEVMELLLGYHWPGNIRELRNTLRVTHAFSDQVTLLPADLPDDFTSKLNSFRYMQNQKTSLHQLKCPPGSGIGNPKVESLVNTLIRNKWNITDSANELGISRATIYRKMKKYDIIPPNHMGV